MQIIFPHNGHYIDSDTKFLIIPLDKKTDLLPDGIINETILFCNMQSIERFKDIVVKFRKGNYLWEIFCYDAPTNISLLHLHILNKHGQRTN